MPCRLVAWTKRITYWQFLVYPNLDNFSFGRVLQQALIISHRKKRVKNGAKKFIGEAQSYDLTIVPLMGSLLPNCGYNTAFPQEKFFYKPL